MLATLGLHGKHGFADHHVGAVGFQTGVGDVALHAACRNRGLLTGEFGDDVHDLRIAVHATVALGVALENRPSGQAQSRGEFDDILAGDVRVGEHAFGEFLAAGAQHVLTDAGQKPMALQVRGVSVGLRQGQLAVGGGFGGSGLKCLRRLRCSGHVS